MVIHITTDEGDYMRCLSWREAYRFVENKMEKEIYELEHKRVEELLNSNDKDKINTKIDKRVEELLTKKEEI